jgi:hypothetical protein
MILYFQIGFQLVMNLHVGEMRPDTVDDVVERHDVGRRILVTEAGFLGPTADQPIGDGRCVPVLGGATGFVQQQ